MTKLRHEDGDKFAALPHSARVAVTEMRSGNNAAVGSPHEPRVVLRMVCASTMVWGSLMHKRTQAVGS